MVHKRLTNSKMLCLREEGSRDSCLSTWLRTAGFSLLLIVLLAHSSSLAQEFGLDSAGARWGFSSRRETHNFNQAETFMNWNLPWSWDLGANWQIKHRLDASVGWLGGAGDDAAIFTL